MVIFPVCDRVPAAGLYFAPMCLTTERRAHNECDSYVLIDLHAADVATVMEIQP